MATVKRSPRTTTSRAAAAPAKPTIVVRTNRAPTNADGKLACAKLPFIAANDAASLAAEAKKVGMTSAGRGKFVHPTDKSWVMLDANGRLQRGVNQTQFQGIPQAYVAPADPADARKLEKLLNDNARIPSSMKSYAITKIGMVNSSTLAIRLPRAGFLKLGTTWVHPDGSWVKDDRGSVSVGWKAHGLSSLPYSNARGWS